MNQPLRKTVLLVGACWAEVLLVAGVWVLLAGLPLSARLAPGLVFVSAGLYVAMMLVIDRLVPDAGRVMVGSLKIAVVLVFCTCTVLTLYALLSG